MQGWLRAISETPPIDFVGAGPVHLLGGVTGLVGAYIVGPRIGFNKKNASSKYAKSHNKVLAASGAYLLWISW